MLALQPPKTHGVTHVGRDMESETEPFQSPKTVTFNSFQTLDTCLQTSIELTKPPPGGSMEKACGLQSPQH